MIRPSRPPRGSRIAGCLIVLAVAAGCVPTPANRASPTGQTSVSAAPVATPTPTPAGPTPTPSFVRPTPTPQPTFLVYTVVAGDTLTSIARRFETTRESVSYWNRATYRSLDPDSASYDPDRLKIGWTLNIIPDSRVDPENLPTLPPAPTPSGSAST